MDTEAVLKTALEKKPKGLIVVLSGAGISAESGIPTFRGEEGYWTVGSRVYRPTEMATNKAFQRMPTDVWKWYLHRRNTCRNADPNPAHKAVSELETALADRFRLATQNVDGLHIRAGNSLDRSYQIHGNIDFKRCTKECSNEIFPLPETSRNDPEFIDSLRCEKCQAPARPHVLWFDEYYNEELYRYESSLQAAANAAILLVVGTSAQTNLPNQMVALAAQQGSTVIDININDNPFSQVARQYGIAIRGKASTHLPPLVAAITRLI